MVRVVSVKDRVGVGRANWRDDLLPIFASQFFKLRRLLRQQLDIICRSALVEHHEDAS